MWSQISNCSPQRQALLLEMSRIQKRAQKVMSFYSQGWHGQTRSLMNRKTQISISIWLLAAGLGANMPGQAEAKSYGSGSGRSYSSSSRSSGGGSRNASSRSTAISSHHTSHGGDLHNSKPTSDPFQSGSGKSYSSG